MSWNNQSLYLSTRPGGRGVWHSWSTRLSSPLVGGFIFCDNNPQRDLEAMFKSFRMTVKNFFKRLGRRKSSSRRDTSKPAEVTVSMLLVFLRSQSLIPHSFDTNFKSKDNPAIIPSQVDDSRTGLFQFSNPIPATHITEDVYNVDIVIIHGLNGHFKRTWTHQNGTCWPQDLLPQALPGARIFSYGYPSQIFASRSVAGIRDFAKQMLSCLELERAEDVCDA